MTKPQLRALMRALMVSGFKGGVGKTLVACAILEYWLKQQKDFRLIEFDTVNPDVRRKYYKTIETMLGVLSDDSGKENAANTIINTPLEHNCDVVINMPAQVFTQLHNWYNRNGIGDLTAELEMELVNIHVSDGNVDSLKIFCRTVKSFPQMSHVFVKNWGMRNNEWHDFENHQGVQTLIREGNIPVIDFPKFHGVSTLQKLDRFDLGFTAALTHEEFDCIERSRIKQFLNKAFFALEQSKVF